MTIALPRQKQHSDWLARLRTIGLGLGGRGVMGLGVGRSSVSAAAETAWWLAGGAPTPVAVYQPIGAASLAASYVNLANPGTYNAAPGTAPTFDAATGWTFNGATQYLITNVTPAQGWTMIVRFNGSNEAGASGSWVSGGRFFFQPRIAGQRGYGAGSFRGVNGVMTAGIMAVAGQSAYVDGVADGTIGGWTAAPRSIYIGALNFAAGPGNYLATAMAVVAIYSTTLTAPQVAAVSAAMAAL